jgi:hypothetical protein
LVGQADNGVKKRKKSKKNPASGCGLMEKFEYPCGVVERNPETNPDR